MRSENGNAQELVRGVDLLAFNYGVQRVDGSTEFLDAEAIENAATSDCTLPPEGMTQESGCLWRSVRTIEPRLLVNSVDEVMSLDPASRSYRFNGTLVEGADVTNDLPSGLKSGSMSRREFVGYFSVRNGNF
jgi:type IV pilus assembly protein PilW